MKLNEKNHLQIIIAVLVCTGVHLIIDEVVRSYQLERSEPSDPLIALIGVVTSSALHLPFFIVAYWLYRKQKLMNYE